MVLSTFEKLFPLSTFDRPLSAVHGHASALVTRGNSSDPRFSEPNYEQGLILNAVYHNVYIDTSLKISQKLRTN